MQENTKFRPAGKKRRRGRSRPVLIGVILFETLLLASCVILAAQLFRQAPEPPETVPTTVPTTTPTEASTAATGLVLSRAELAIRTFCEENNLSPSLYPEDLVDLLERNPETQEFVLNYPLEAGKTHEVDLSKYEGSETVPLFLQWDQRWGYLDYGGEVAGLSACGPVCLSMVVCYLTGDYSQSPDRMIRFAIDNGYCAPGNGSYWSLISEGGAYFGLEVTEFAPEKQRVLANLEVGNPIICIMGPGNFTSSGHFIVLTGLEDGLIRVNDPNSIANSQRLWNYDDIGDQILDVWVLRQA